MRNLLSLLLLIAGSVLGQIKSPGTDLSFSKELNLAEFGCDRQTKIPFPESATIEIEEQEQTLEYLGAAMAPDVQKINKGSEKLLAGHNTAVFTLFQQQSGIVSDPSPPV